MLMSSAHIVDELMLCSESVGVMDLMAVICRLFWLIISAQGIHFKMTKYHVKEIILNHYGPVRRINTQNLGYSGKLGATKQMTDNGWCTSDEEALKELREFFMEM